MKYCFYLIFLYLASFPLKAQYTYSYKPVADYQPNSLSIPKFDVLDIRAAKAKLYQRNYGVILGLQRGKATFFEFGSEIHWRKVRLNNPRLIAATANVAYNLADNVLGYQAGFWTKRGRIALTLGANAGYYTDFHKGSFALGPTVGFRLLGFHLSTGYNYLFNKGVSEVIGEKSLSDKVNNFHVGLQYYFPLDNKFRWGKKDKDKEKIKKKKRKAKDKKNKRKEKQKKANQREKEKLKQRKNKDNKKNEDTKWRPFDFLKKKS